MNRIKRLLLTAAIVSFGAMVSAAPSLVKSTPPDGAHNVSVDVGKIVLVFDQNMNTDSWTLMTVGNRQFPPMVPDQSPWADPLTFEINLAKLKSNTTYAIQLNGARRRGFLSAADGSALPVTTISFRTASETSAAAAGDDRPAWDTDSLPAPGEEDVSGIRPGWKFLVTRQAGINATIRTDSQEIPLRYHSRFEFAEEVIAVSERRVTQATREVLDATIHVQDEETYELVKKHLAMPGQKLTVEFSGFDTLVSDGETGRPVTNELVAEAFSIPVAMPLWPKGDLPVGRQWSYTGNEVTQRLKLMSAQGGQLDLHVERIETDKETGQETAVIRGRLQTKIPIDFTALDFEAQVAVNLPLGIGTPFLIRIQGTISDKGSVQNQMGETVEYTIYGTASALQVCRPQKEVLAALVAATPTTPVAELPESGMAPGAGDLIRGLPTAPEAATGPGDADALAHLKAFVAPGADCAALTRQLRPTDDDVKAVFLSDAAGAARAGYNALWNANKIKVAPRAGETEVRVTSATTDALRAGTDNAREFPAGWRDAASRMKSGIKVFRFVFAEPGEGFGRAYDGLVFLNGRWVIFPNPWRVLGN